MMADEAVTAETITQMKTCSFQVESLFLVVLVMPAIKATVIGLIIQVLQQRLFQLTLQVKAEDLVLDL